MDPYGGLRSRRMTRCARPHAPVRQGTSAARAPSRRKPSPAWPPTRWHGPSAMPLDACVSSTSFAVGKIASGSRLSQHPTFAHHRELDRSKRPQFFKRRSLKRSLCGCRKWLLWTAPAKTESRGRMRRTQFRRIADSSFERHQPVQRVRMRAPAVQGFIGPEQWQVGGQLGMRECMARTGARVLPPQIPRTTRGVRSSNLALDAS